MRGNLPRKIQNRGERVAMNRELLFQITEINEIRVYSDSFTGVYDGRRLFAGYSGENEATRLKFEFSTDFDSYTKTLQFNVAGTWTTVDSAAVNFEYDITSTYTVPELIEARIMFTSGTQILCTQTINLEIKR